MHGFAAFGKTPPADYWTKHERYMAKKRRNSVWRRSQRLRTSTAWLIAAAKTANIARQSPLHVKPMMVLVEDKQNDIKHEFLYDRLPVGGKVRVLPSAEKFDENPQKLPRDRKAGAVAMLAACDPEQLVTRKAEKGGAARRPSSRGRYR